MCGFAVFFSRKRNFNQHFLKQVSQDLIHRGPDSEGITSGPGWSMVFRRLAIMDPTTNANQPMSDSTKNYRIVFNGEIYNYIALRKELITAGYVFQTNSDTEVILNGYIHWGSEVFKKLEGMFSIAIINLVDRIAVVARDPLGIKPLYMSNYNGIIAFASETKPLRRLVKTKVDINSLSELMIFRFASGELSNYEKIEKIIGGTLITISLDNLEVNKTKYFNILDTFGDSNNVSVKKYIEDSVSTHMQSDVGYALQLSGGVDSSLIAAIVREKTVAPLSSFGLKLSDDEKYDESSFQESVARKFKIDHNILEVGEREFSESLPRAIHFMEGPVPHFGCVYLMLLSGLIKKTNKVVLTGEGADEMFGGYMRYQLWKNLQRKGVYAKLIPNHLWPYLTRYKEIQRYSGRDPAIYGSVYHDFLTLFDLFPSLVPKAGYRDKTLENIKDFRTRMFIVDQTSYLESLLMRQDRMSMSHSVESRVPFVHLPLIKAVNSLSNNYRCPGGETKPILKNIARKYLSKELVDRRKIGLTLPLDDWLRDKKSNFSDYISDLVSVNSEISQYTDIKKLKKSVNDFSQNKNNSRLPIAHLINIELWLKSVKNDPVSEPIFTK
jgi:asparagine synthase (glutamine-hydrolysing)